MKCLLMTSCLILTFALIDARRRGEPLPSSPVSTASQGRRVQGSLSGGRVVQNAASLSAARASARGVLPTNPVVPPPRLPAAHPVPIGAPAARIPAHFIATYTPKVNTPTVNTPTVNTRLSAQSYIVQRNPARRTQGVVRRTQGVVHRPQNAVYRPQNAVYRPQNAFPFIYPKAVISPTSNTRARSSIASLHSQRTKPNHNGRRPQFYPKTPTVPAIFGPNPTLPVQGSNGCSNNRFPLDCRQATTCQNQLCKAYPNAECRMDSCDSCKPKFFVEDVAVNCNLCRTGYTPTSTGLFNAVTGLEDACRLSNCPGDTYCQPNYCTLPSLSAPTFTCVPNCRDSVFNDLIGDGRQRECLIDPCNGVSCSDGYVCSSNFCTCNAVCIPATSAPVTVTVTAPAILGPNVALATSDSTTASPAAAESRATDEGSDTESTTAEGSDDTSTSAVPVSTEGTSASESTAAAATEAESPEATTQVPSTEAPAHSEQAAASTAATAESTDAPESAA